MIIIALVLAMPALCLAQNFDGLFTVDVPVGQHYSNVAWCLPNGRLGCANEYWEDNADCEIDGNEIVIYYYDNSLLVEGESNALQHALHGLNTSYLYKIHGRDGNLFVLSNDIGMRKMPPYLVGVANDEGSEVVFVGGNNLNDLKRYASSVKFV